MCKYLQKKKKSETITRQFVVGDSSSRSSELTGYKVSHSYLQHHHHHWPHHHRRQHNQHDVHQLFQCNLILRIPTTPLSPRHALAEMVSPRGLQVTATQRNNNWTTFSTPLTRFSSVMIRHALFPQAPCSSWLPSLYYRSPYDRGYYQTSKMMLSGRQWQLFVNIL